MCVFVCSLWLITNYSRLEEVAQQFPHPFRYAFWFFFLWLLLQNNKMHATLDAKIFFCRDIASQSPADEFVFLAHSQIRCIKSILCLRIGFPPLACYRNMRYRNRVWVWVWTWKILVWSTYISRLQVKCSDNLFFNLISKVSCQTLLRKWP